MSSRDEFAEQFETSLERRVEILAEFTEAFMKEENPRIKDFFASNDLGLPFAYGAAAGLVILTETGAHYVNTPWWELCDLLRVEPDNDYEDLDHFLQTGWL